MKDHIRINYRLYPNEEQQTILIQWFGCVRFIWNYMLSLNNTTYDNTGKFVFNYDMCNMLPNLKKTYSWLKDTPAQSLQQRIISLDLAIKHTYKKIHGFPKFKAKFFDTTGIAFPQHWKIKDNKLFLPKMKKGIKVVIDRPLPGKAKTCTVYKNKSGQWFVSIVVELPDGYIPSLKDEHEIIDIIALDLGIKDFVITSDGEIFENMRFLKKKSKKQKRMQRAFSRSKKGSKNREKKRKKLAVQFRKVTNQRKDYSRKVANYIAKNNDLVCAENLNVAGMIRNPKLAGAIADVGWGMFISELEWQCKKHGTHFVKVGRTYPSTKTCSNCGHKKDEMPLEIRVFDCEKCDLVMDRDANAALNIKQEGIKLFESKTKYTVGTTEINARQICGLIGDTGRDTCCSRDNK